MAVSATVERFLDHLRRSELIDAGRLQAFLAGRPADEPASDLARALVEAGLLTHFQAGELLRGRWRGFRLGKYRILDRLGQGGMGQVYLAVHLRMGHQVALKVVPPGGLSQPGVRERFLREARATAQLAHPNLVHALDVDSDGDVLFLVLEFIDGVNLESLVRKRGPLSVVRAVHCVRQAAAGLQYAHERGLVHRDVKPANLVMDRGGIVKVLDLGLARFFDAARDDRLTERYDRASVLGTADYLAPEQALNSRDADIRADIYSLGATLYFLLAGRPPFDLPSARAKLLAAQSSDPPRLEQVARNVPAGLAAVVRTMMARDREQRYATPAEVVAALAPWHVAPLPPPPDEDFPRQSRALQGPTSSRVRPISGSSVLRPEVPEEERPADATPRPHDRLAELAPPQEPAPQPRRRGRSDALLAVTIVGTILAALVALVALVMAFGRSPFQ